MNLISIIILVLVVVAFVAAARLAFFSRRGKRSGCCGSASESQCQRCRDAMTCDHRAPDSEDVHTEYSKHK